jgi:hypothetical protein
MLSVPTRSIRLIALFAAAFALLALTILMPSPSMAALSVGAVPVHGKLSDGGKFRGEIRNIDVSYNADRDILKVSGKLVGTATKANGVERAVSERFNTKAVAQTSATSCKILDLDIGRIHLDLLGLVVDLAPIHLDVTAVPGAGNLLGNLLCAVAGLFDPNNALANFLDGLLRALFPV